MPGLRHSFAVSPATLVTNHPILVAQTEDLLETRKSLISRLKNYSDQESWRAFFDVYSKLIYTTAVRAGLDKADAQDVLQETVISVSKAIRRFKYDSRKGSFRNWL